MTPLESLLIERIGRDGPMPFAAYMSLALYHPRYGYYAREQRTGWRGDFVTSPELHPAFGKLWARGFEELWELCNRPAAFDIVEVGPGEARFAEAVLDATSSAFAGALSYRLVERSSFYRERQQQRLGSRPRVAWSSALAEVPPVDHGCVFANEVLDNLPVHLVERVGGELREVYVTVNEGCLASMSGPLSTPELQAHLLNGTMSIADGARAEISLATDALLRAAASVVGRGALVFIDYGAPEEELLSKPEGSLACYSSAGADDNVFEAPGDKDITAHVNWDAVRRGCDAAGLTTFPPTPQHHVLRALGAPLLDTGYRSEYERAIATGDGPGAVSSLSARQALGILTDAHGLGRLDVVVATKDIPTPSFVTRRSSA